MASVTSFPADAVPQAPEDSLFGLARAFKADSSSDKVDLVGWLQTLLAFEGEPTHTHTHTHRVSEPIAATMRSLGSFPLSKRYATTDRIASRPLVTWCYLLQCQPLHECLALLQ